MTQRATGVRILPSMVGSFPGHPTGQKAAAGGDAGGNGGNGYHSLSAVCVPVSVQNAFYPCLVPASQEMGTVCVLFFFFSTHLVS